VLLSQLGDYAPLRLQPLQLLIQAVVIHGTITAHLRQVGQAAEIGRISASLE